MKLKTELALFFASYVLYLCYLYGAFMNLVVQKSGKYQYVSFRESYWDPVKKKYSSRTVKNFGRLDLLEKNSPNILEELRAQVQSNKAALVDEKQKILKARVDRASVSASSATNAYADNRVVNLGGCIYRQVWNKLNLSRKLRDIQKQTNIEFDFPESVFFMATARSLQPDSKLSQWQKRNQFLYGSSELSLNHLYRSLDLLVEKKQDLVRYLNKQIQKQYNRMVTVALYDVTTYYFESQDADTLRNFDFSKDNKVNQVQVVMGLLIDENGIPIDYELFPGNTNEFSTMIPILKKLKADYGIENVIVTADRGLNSGANLKAILDLGMNYVIAYRLRTAGKRIIDLIQNDSSWKSWSANGIREVSKYCQTTETRTVRFIDERGHWVNERITSNLLINYSAKRARKDANDRQRLVDKATKLAENPSLVKSELKKGGKSYLKVEAGSLRAELDREKIEKAEIFDGYYGIVYSDKTMSPEQVLSIHHSLWQIEESFRISKSLLEARPCFHWKEQRIKGHFFICFLALVLHRLLEWELHKQGVEMPAEQIISALQNATLQEIILGTGNAVYCKSQTEGAFEAMAKAVGLGRLPRLAKAAEVKTAMKLKELK